MTHQLATGRIATIIKLDFSAGAKSAALVFVTSFLYGTINNKFNLSYRFAFEFDCVDRFTVFCKVKFHIMKGSSVFDLLSKIIASVL